MSLLTVGILDSRGVLIDPVLDSSHPSVYTREVRVSASDSEAHNSNQGEPGQERIDMASGQFVPLILTGDKGTTGVSLTGILTRVSSADHGTHYFKGR